MIEKTIFVLIFLPHFDICPVMLFLETSKTSLSLVWGYFGFRDLKILATEYYNIIYYWTSIELENI